ncbi:MAG TPA: hypothetical protein VKH34_15920 [Vicinamibacterales bacterium]|nr:hypothetical protein [Vicinamibacterales bacterium]
MIRSVLSFALAYLLLGTVPPKAPASAAGYEAGAVRFGILPGHDPLVFERFPTVSPGVVRIK